LEKEKLVREITGRVMELLGDMSVASIAGDVDAVVTSAMKGQMAWQWDYTLTERTEIINSVRAELSKDEVIEDFCSCEIEETGMGRLEDKRAKIRLALDKTPGPEFFKANAASGDHGLVLEEMSPFGVIASFTPSTDSVATILNNAICMISGGNGVIFAPHPSAIRSGLFAVRKAKEALEKFGAPQSIISAVTGASGDYVDKLLNHRSVAMVSMTGGSSAASAVLRAGKPAVVAGPGNPPVLVDETADLRKAANDIIQGCSFDNNLSCAAEKELFVVHRAADELRKHMLDSGLVFEIRNPSDIKKLLGAVMKKGSSSRDMTGNSPSSILSEIGISIPEEVRVILVETGETHYFMQEELMMPILPMARVLDFKDGLASALRLERGFRHSASIHSTNINHMSVMARAMETAVFTKNAPSYTSIGYNSDCPATFTIATITGQGPATPLTFCRTRRCVLAGSFRII
jgi:propionaldehyde dehydrogenase